MMWIDFLLGREESLPQTHSPPDALPQQVEVGLAISVAIAIELNWSELSFWLCAKSGQLTCLRSVVQ